MLSKVFSAAIIGLDAVSVEVAVDIASLRLPSFITVGLIGGGTNLSSGAIACAHRGILFLDKFPEFPRNVLESLRQPIEDTIISISRAKGKMTFPAKCMVIASQNLSPCGYLGDNSCNCICTMFQISRFKKKNSGPLLDRIDFHRVIPVGKVEKLTEQETNHVENSDSARKRIQDARLLIFGKLR